MKGKEDSGYVLEMAISWDLKGHWKQKQMETVRITPADTFRAHPRRGFPSFLYCPTSLSLHSYTAHTGHWSLLDEIKIIPLFILIPCA